MSLAHALPLDGQPDRPPGRAPGCSTRGSTSRCGPMRYPDFYDMYRDAIRNTWTVEEVDFNDDLDDLARKLDPAERHLVHRLVAFFATGDSIVANNVVLNLYKHINAPEARLYLSRQLYEEALHVQFYLTLLDTYLPDMAEREQAFAAIEHIPSIRAKAEFCIRWMDSMSSVDELRHPRRPPPVRAQPHLLRHLRRGPVLLRRLRLRVLLPVEGPPQRPGLGHQLGVPRRVDAHALRPRRWSTRSARRSPTCSTPSSRPTCTAMIDEAVEAELVFAEDLLSGGVSGLSVADTREYLRYVADQRLGNLGMAPRYGARNPFDFMMLQDVQELSNFFERRVSAYQVGITGEVAFDADF